MPKSHVNHQKLLGETQFEGIKGSPQYATMTMNRVWVNLPTDWGHTTNTREGEFQIEKDFILKHLAQVCRNYYFIGQRSAASDYSVRVYFLSKWEMEDFIVWSKLTFPRKNIADKVSVNA